MKRIVLLFVSLLTLVSASAREFKDIISAQASQVNRVDNQDLDLELPKFIFSHTNSRVIVKFKNPAHDKLVSNNYKLHFIVNGNDQLVEFDHEGLGNITCTFNADSKLTVLFENASFTKNISVISIWYMVLPLAGLFLFLAYRVAFAKKKMTLITNKDVTERKIDATQKSGGLKIVKEEEELLA